MQGACDHGVLRVSTRVFVFRSDVPYAFNAVLIHPVGVLGALLMVARRIGEVVRACHAVVDCLLRCVLGRGLAVKNGYVHLVVKQ